MTSTDVTLIVVGSVLFILGFALGYFVAARIFRQRLRVMVAELEELQQMMAALLAVRRA